MCGISGFFGTTLALNLAEKNLKSMAHGLSHRGPDHLGVKLYPECRAGFAHNRLSILDLNERSHQPFRVGDKAKGDFSIVFNGEIYNYIEVRKRLVDEGIEFSTTSDTEVFLKAYIQWGPNCLHEFNGMWACVILDHRKKNLFVSTDRFGVKPIYYRFHESGFWFASEMKAFRDAQEFMELKPNVDHVLLSLLTFHGLEGAGATPYQDLERLPAGMNLTFSLDEQRASEPVDPVRWWNTFEHTARTYGKQNSKMSIDAAALQFREIFDDACKLRLRSDVDVATSLSGGLDSSSVCASVAHLLRNEKSSQKYQAFIFRPYDPKQNEWNYAKLVLDAYPELSPVILDESQKVYENEEDLERIIRHHEMIYGGYVKSSYDLYAKMHSTGLKVCLDGHGADEYLGGYHQYPILKVVSELAPRLQWKKMDSILSQQIGDFYSAKFCAKEFFKQRMPQRLQDVSVILGNLWFFKRMGIFNGSYRDILSLLDRLLQVIKQRRSRLHLNFKFADPLDNLLYEDTHISVLPRILRNFDVASMRSAVEVRMPFMDYRLISFAFSLPSSLKVDPQTGYTKLVLREAMRGRLPQEVLARRLKLGFSSSSPSDEVIWKMLQKNPLTLPSAKIRTNFSPRPGSLSYFDKGKLWRLAVAGVVLAKANQPQILN